MLAALHSCPHAIIAAIVAAQVSAGELHWNDSSAVPHTAHHVVVGLHQALQVGRLHRLAQQVLCGAERHTSRLVERDTKVQRRPFE